MRKTDRTRTIYLDYCATTPVDRRVRDVMMPFFDTEFGNPASSGHSYGQRAAEAVEVARGHVAALAGCTPDEVIWTSGATEANNLAIKGTRLKKAPAHVRVVTQATEHPAVLEPGQSVPDCDVLRVDGAGKIDLDQLSESLGRGPALVSIMAANNETGVLFPLERIASIAHQHGAVLHSDASQLFGKQPISTVEYDLLSVSSHKLYGPKGAGALIARRASRDIRLTPQLQGGGQERGIRSGTLNVPAIVGFGEACRIAQLEMSGEAHRLSELRDAFEQNATAALDGVVINGGASPRLPNISNLSFLNVDAESLILSLGEIAISSGSACTSSSLEPSHVLRAMCLDELIQKSAVRVSFGRPSTREDVAVAISSIVRSVDSLRALATAW